MLTAMTATGPAEPDLGAVDELEPESNEPESDEAEDGDPEKSVEDLEAILPPPGVCVIDGIDCQVRHLKAREFFMLMGVITSGVGPSISEMRLSGLDGDEMGEFMAGVLIMAIPQSYPQFLNLVVHVCEPKSGDKQERKRLKEYLNDPEIDDLLPVVDAIIENEKDNFMSLLGKARAYLARWQKTFKKTPTPG